MRISGLPLKTMLAGGGLLCLAAAVARWDSVPSDAGRIWIGERALLRKMIRSKPISVPSTVSRAGGQGVVVSSLVIDTKGKVSQVSIVQSPHPALAETLRSSLRGWAFSETTIRGRPVEITGKVTLYLVNQDGMGRLLSPQEMIERQRASGLQADIKETAQIVDVRVRDEFEMESTPKALNIPLDELQVRGPVELNPQIPVSIDCTRTPMDRCRTAESYLRGEGFEHVSRAGDGVPCTGCR